MRRAGLWAATASVALTAGACSASTSPSATSTSVPSTTAAAAPALAQAGPYAVGETTLDLGGAGSLGERFATVFYPAQPATIAGYALFSYQLGAPLPAALVAILPAKDNPTISVDAHVDAPGSGAGPFPIVLFSHGDGASRLYYSHLLSGIASWGFVTVSADYLERGILAQATHSTVPDSPAIDLRTMLSSLTATESASAEPSSPLYGVADAAKVAAVGHSAGGQTAFDALADSRVSTAVGWAPEGPSGAASDKPVEIIGEQEDIALTPSELAQEFHAFPGPTTYVQISGEGHNTYTDTCTAIRSGGGGLVGLAIKLHVIGGELAKLGVNGCTAKNLPPQRFWPIVQYYTVAALQHGLGIGNPPAPSPVTPGQFPGFTVTVRQHP